AFDRQHRAELAHGADAGRNDAGLVSAPRISIQQKFAEALDELVALIREDRSILAAILCGSLSHDTVWEKSDIDLGLITIDDKIPDRGISLYADGINVHA